MFTLDQKKLGKACANVFTILENHPHSFKLKHTPKTKRMPFELCETCVNLLIFSKKYTNTPKKKERLLVHTHKLIECMQSLRKLLVHVSKNDLSPHTK
jgi:hypothetical protein